MDTLNTENANEADFQIVMNFPLTIYESDSEFSSSDWVLEMSSRGSDTDPRSEISLLRSRASQLALGSSSLSDDDYSHISSVKQRFSKAEFIHMNEAARLVRRRISSDRSLVGFELYRALNTCKRYHKKLSHAIEELLNYDKNIVPTEWIDTAVAMSLAVSEVKFAPASSMLRMVEDRNVYGLCMSLDSQNDEAKAQSSMALLDILRSRFSQSEDNSDMLGPKSVEFFDFDLLLHRTTDVTLEDGLRLVSALIVMYLIPYKNLEELEVFTHEPTDSLRKIMLSMNYVTTCDPNILSFVSSISQEEIMVACWTNLSRIWFAIVEPLLQLDFMEAEQEITDHAGRMVFPDEGSSNHSQQNDRHDRAGHINHLIPEVFAMISYIASFLEEAQRVRIEGQLYKDSGSIQDNVKAALSEQIVNTDEIESESYELV